MKHAEPLCSRSALSEWWGGGNFSLTVAFDAGGSVCGSTWWYLETWTLGVERVVRPGACGRLTLEKWDGLRLQAPGPPCARTCRWPDLMGNLEAVTEVSGCPLCFLGVWAFIESLKLDFSPCSLSQFFSSYPKRPTVSHSRY